MREIKNGDLVLIKSPIDRKEVVALIVSVTSTPAGTVEVVNSAFEFDDMTRPDLSYVITEDMVRNLVLDNLGNHLEYFSAHMHEYRTILKHADVSLGPVAMTRAILLLSAPGTPTIESSVLAIIQEAKQEGDSRVSILQKKIDEVIASIATGNRA